MRQIGNKIFYRSIYFTTLIDNIFYFNIIILVNIVYNKYFFGINQKNIFFSLLLY